MRKERGIVELRGGGSGVGLRLGLTYVSFEEISYDQLLEIEDR